MVTPTTCCAPTEAGGRRYSRGCLPYSFAYPDRRFHLSSHDNRAIIMAEREDSDQPRKRIAVACGRCRKRKIRCSGDPGNGGPCSNCKNAGYEPCLFLRVSSQETPLKDATDFSYNLDAARAYAHHARGPVSPLSPLPQYAHEMAAAAGDGLAAYRQSPYAYGGGGGGSKGGYYPNMSGWTSAYQDEGGVDYGLNYSSYQILNPEPSALVSGYSPYGGGGGGRKSVYVDPEAGASYTYGSLTHRPAVPASGDGGGQGFSLSSMAASLPIPNPSDRLHSSVNRTLTSSSSYRSDGITPTPYASSGKTAPAAIPDVTSYGNLQPAFESAYSTANTLASAIAHRATAHADATYPTSASAATTATAADQLYGGAAVDQPIRSTEDAGVSYIYGDSKLCGGGGGGGGSGSGGSGSGSGSRRNSPSGAGVGSLLSNGHAYVPESHSAHHAAAHAYVVPGVAASSGSQGRGTPADASSGAAARGSGSGSSGNGGISGGSVGGGGGSSHRLSDSHNRRSAGSLRGG